MKNTLNNLEIYENIRFIIKYCDTYLDYCHEENLSIDGNIAGEIIDSITGIEDYLEDPDMELTDDELDEIYDEVTNIYDGLTSLNDIKLFNSSHIVFSIILNQILERKEKEN